MKRSVVIAVTIVAVGGALIAASPLLHPGGASPAQTSEPLAGRIATVPMPCVTPSGEPQVVADSRPTVVFLDPGHGANVNPTAATSGGSKGIFSGENSSGGNEDADVFEVAKQAAALLGSAGYTVVLSRSGQPDPDHLTLWQKGLEAETANNGGPADIGVSIHTDTRADIGAGQIYYDLVGGYRTNNDDATTATFTNTATAALSEQYAQNFLTARQATATGNIKMTAGHDFPASRNLGSHGNMPIIMLTAQDVPWVYNEMPRTTAKGLSKADITSYAKAIATGVETSVGPTVPMPTVGTLVPVVCGTPAVGQTLSVETGDWSPSSVVLSYQWLRDQTAIPGATAAQYVVTPDDAGHDIAVQVTGQADGYANSVMTSSTLTVG